MKSHSSCRRVTLRLRNTSRKALLSYPCGWIIELCLLISDNDAEINGRLKLVILRSMSDSNDAKLWRPVGEAGCGGGGRPTPNLLDLEQRLESSRILERSSVTMKYLLGTYILLTFFFMNKLVTDVIVPSSFWKKYVMLWILFCRFKASLFESAIITKRTFVWL